MFARPASFASLDTDSWASKTPQRSPCCVRRACAMARSEGIDIRLLRGWTNEPGCRAWPRPNGPRPMDEEHDKTPALAWLAVFGPSSGAGAWPPRGAAPLTRFRRISSSRCSPGKKPRVRVRQTAELGVRSIVNVIIAYFLFGNLRLAHADPPKSQLMVPPPAPKATRGLSHALIATPTPPLAHPSPSLVLSIFESPIVPRVFLRAHVSTHVLNPLILTSPI
ncbi:hypothetical protein B0T18DRAFT_8282 [Schizothecium vesticola]|uniref:Uncharacterized protein n=1 Tax=Schizothecium vesticola TaxID=314040 RepID=A0AA40F8H7_9PEZI|nr:hypothetical protein B0T18DRAFT_8282 [Schizothecium vesticola]